MIPYENISARLHKCAHRYQCNFFEHWELVNEAWIAVHQMSNIKLVMLAIPYRMIDYMRRETQYRFRRNHNKGGGKRIGFISLYHPVGIEGMTIKDVIENPKCYNGDTDNIDTINWLMCHSGLSMRDRLILDMRFHKGMTCKEIGAAVGIDKNFVSQQFRLIKLKMTTAARRLEMV